MAPIYKNAPLVSTAFEARFYGDLSIETKRDVFQQKVKQAFPHLYVPKAAFEKSPALQHYHFRKEDKSSIIGLAVNSFTYTDVKYPGFDRFKEELEAAWSVFANTFDIPVFTRLGLRYTNHLALVRDEGGKIPLAKYITANPAAGFGIGDLYDINLNTSGEVAGGRLRTMLENQKAANGLEILAMDFDFFRIGSINPSERGAFIESAHEVIEGTFLRLISEEYKSIMDGGTDGWRASV